MKVKKILIEAEETVTKADEVEETPVADEPKAEEKTEETPEPAVVEEKAEEKTEEAPVAEAPVEAKAEEAEAEKPEEPAKETAEATAEVQKEEKTEDTEIVVKLDFSDFKDSFEKMVSPLIENVKSLAEKVDGLAKAAPTEGAADAEETPTEVVETPAKAEEAPIEEVKKSDTSSEGASQTDLLLQKISELKSDLEARLTKVESQPVPSKVVVVTKGDQGEEVTELQKVNDRLAEIEKMRDADPVTYMRNLGLVDEALKLIAEKRKLMGGK